MGRLPGNPIPTTLGAPTETVSSGTQEWTAVEMPASSITRATSPTDRQQKGQTGTIKAKSTSSLFMPSTIFGAVTSRSSPGLRMYPMIE